VLLRRIGFHVLITGCAICFCLLMFHRGRSVEQYNDFESDTTVQEARDINDGFHRWGLVQYTHHPIGRAYALIPLVRVEAEPLELFPTAVAVACAGFALWALLHQASGVAMGSYVVLLFLSMLWQPGFVGWIGNLHQQSYNMSSILLIIGVGVSARRATVPFVAIGFVFGWIGYDFVFLQVFTAATVRFAMLVGRPSGPLWRATLRAAGEAAAFSAAFLLAVLLHMVQNTLYFSSASMAYWDLFGSLSYRVDPPTDTRLVEAFHSARLYVADFFDPEKGWADLTLLRITLGSWCVATIASVLRLVYLDGSEAALSRRSFTMVVCSAGAIAPLLIWFVAMPNHTRPHIHLFPRMFFVPLLVMSAVTVLAVTPIRPIRAAIRVRGPIIALAVFAVLAVALMTVPRLTHAAIDRRFFDTIWVSPTASIRADKIAAPLLRSRPTASSVAPDATLDGPIGLKTHTLVGDFSYWARGFDSDPAARWAPDPSDEGPHWFAQSFPGPSVVTDVALRFWDLPIFRGASTPDSFEVEALSGDESIVAAAFQYPDGDAEVVKQGKYLCLHHRFSPPVTCDGLRITIHGTVGGIVPIMTDFLCFGEPLTMEPTVQPTSRGGPQ
jgi:hypothetical protein